KTGNSSPFELCGPFEGAGHYNSDSGKTRFRLRLVEPASASAPITLNEEPVSQQLPRLESCHNWSNFKRHFCRQGASLQKPLAPEVVDILSELVGNSGTTQRHAPTTFQELEKAFQEDVEKSRNLTSEER